MSDIERMLALPGARTLPAAGSRLSRALAGDTGPWRGAIGGLWLAGAAVSAAGMLGSPTGLGTAVDIVTAVAMHTGAFALSALLIAWALTFVPRLAGPYGTLGGLLYTAVLAFFLLYFSDMGVAVSLIVGSGYALAAAAGGWLLTAALARGSSSRQRGASVLALALCGGIAAWNAAPDWSLGTGSDDDSGGLTSASGLVSYRPLTTGDPALPGSYSFASFTYGSGDDRRSEFAGGARLISKPADASAYLKSWPLLRRWFWGFGPRELPLNGRVWMPEGEGQHPLVLIVHGNHAMEDYSDAGYAYLGEQLASRGYIAVSVDENFLNYSVWSGIPKQDMLLRAWLLLKHIGQLQAFAADPDSPFYDKIDLQRIALVGHSRGGQAVAMAADRGTWFADDASLPPPDSYRIAAVAAIAPTDTAVDDKLASLRNISYLTLQGSADGDINDFYGDRQYGRTQLGPASGGAFKASLYIEGANHGQFNESWGARDSSIPAGLLLRKPELGEDDQQRIAKAYLTAFMETALRGNDSYRPLFEDYRSALAYLPATRYVSRYESADFRAAARFDEADADAAHPGEGLTGTASGLSAAVEEAQDRQRQGKGNRGLVLEWSAPGSYALSLERPAAISAAGGDSPALSFALADLSRDLPGWDGETSAAAFLSVELTDGEGVRARLPLSAFAAPQPLFRAEPTYLGPLEPLVDEGKFKERYEPVFQTYRLPLAAWKRANPAFDPASVAAISFVADRGAGKAMVDDIGFLR